jgi:hypothetical protein
LEGELRKNLSETPPRKNVSSSVGLFTYSRRVKRDLNAPTSHTRLPDILTKCNKLILKSNSMCPALLKMHFCSIGKIAKIYHHTFPIISRERPVKIYQFLDFLVCKYAICQPAPTLEIGII